MARLPRFSSFRREPAITSKPEAAEATFHLTLPQLILKLQENDNFLLVSHADPDGDAIGSELGLAYVLQALGKQVHILNADAYSDRFQCFDPLRQIKSLATGDPVPEDLGQKFLIILDTSDYNHTRQAKDVLIPFARSIMVIDHHTPPPTLSCPAFIDDMAAGTSQIVFEIAQALGIALSLEVASALFMGIVYDTGSFIYPKTSARTFEIAAELVKLGVRPQAVHSALFETIAPTRMKLLARVQATLRLVHDNRTAVQLVTTDMILDCAATASDAENFINYPLKCSSVLVSVFLKEVEPGVYRCSLRSKAGVDISTIALARGGGGHRTAAGFLCPALPLATLELDILESIRTLYPEG